MAWNEGCAYREQLGPEAEGEGLLTYLCRRYNHSSPSDWLDRIRAGDVRIDGAVAAPDARLRRGQRLLWNRPPWDEPEAELAFAILYEDDDVLAVSKPAGLPTLPGAHFLQSTLLRRVQLMAPAATAVHRLGRWTSGVSLFAKSAVARTALSHQLRSRQIEKRYRALASGTPSWDTLVVDRPIGRAPHPLLGSVYAATADGKPSESRIEVLERRESSFLCDVRIATGRPHQIRIHLAACGHPLAGDPLYVAGGVPHAGTRALPGDPGYKLHAAEAAFRHPRTGELTRVTSPPPVALRPAGWSAGAPDVRF